MSPKQAKKSGKQEKAKKAAPEATPKSTAEAKATPKPKAAPPPVSPLKALYEKEAIPLLQERLKISNRYAVPRIKYVKVNVGIGSYVTAGKDYEEIVKNIMKITGQRPVVIKSKKSISNFKLKVGMPVGVTATLRGKRMYEFLWRLVNAVLPRIRDFRGIPRKAFDGRGNYSLGIREHIVFPEIDPEDISKIHGIQITIVTDAKTDERGYALLEALKFPFKKVD